MTAAALSLRTADFIRSGLDDRSLRRLHEAGRLHRLLPGTYVRSDTWSELDERQRYVVRIHATVERLATPVTVSHWSAAAVLGFPVPEAWPTEVQVIDERRRTSNRIRSLHRRPGFFEAGDRAYWEGLSITTPARTAADLALICPFADAVVVFDHGLHTKSFDREEVAEILRRRPDARRRTSARAALEFADSGAESVGESFSRVGMAERGLPAPILQEPFFDRRGRIGRADFWWPDQGVVGEFDGLVKYFDPALLQGRTAPEVIADEKRRHNRLQAHPLVRTVVRWDYPVARNPDELARRLLAAGLPRIRRARLSSG